MKWLVTHLCVPCDMRAEEHIQPEECTNSDSVCGVSCHSTKTSVHRLLWELALSTYVTGQVVMTTRLQ